MPLIATLTLPNPGPVLSTFVRIQYAETEYGAEIESIELYADAECKKLLADFCVEDLPVAMQEPIYKAIDDKRYQARRAKGLLRLKADLEADYAARLVGGARA